MNVSWNRKVKKGAAFELDLVVRGGKVPVNLK